MRPEKVLLYVVGGIVLLAVIAGVAAGLRPENRFEPGTPEAAVQGYLQAIFDGDPTAAAAFVASGSHCDAADLERAMIDRSARVVLRDSDMENGTARVHVEMVFSSPGGPFDTYEYSQDHTFHLEREGPDWRITGEPWPAFACPEGDQ